MVHRKHVYCSIKRYHINIFFLKIAIEYNNQKLVCNVLLFLMQVTLLFPLFQEQDQPQQQEAGQILQDVNDYNRRYSGQARPVSKDDDKKLDVIFLW